MTCAHFARVLLAACLTSIVTTAALHAQLRPDPREAELALLRARAELTRAGGEYERSRALFERGMAPVAELEARRAALDAARIDVELGMLHLARTGSRLIVTRAVRTQDQHGLRVRVELMRTGSSATTGDSGSPSGPPAVWVSLKNEPGATGTVISQPYERVARFVAGHAVAEFRLLRDVSELVVSAFDGELLHERKVLLTSDAASEGLEIVAPQFAQEADLASQATFELQLRRASVADAVYRLEISDLPRDIAREFRDTRTGARINQVRMGSGEQRQTVQLVLSLPAGETDSVRVDRTIRFRVSAGGGNGRNARSGGTELELLPRGLARAELRVVQTLREARPGDTAFTPIVVRNTGSRALETLRLHVEAPSGWAVTIDTSSIRLLDVGAERRIALGVSPGAAAEPGEYDIALRLEAAAARRHVEVSPVSFRVRVERRTGGGFLAVVAMLSIAAVGSVSLLRRSLHR